MARRVDARYADDAFARLHHDADAVRASSSICCFDMMPYYRVMMLRRAYTRACFRHCLIPLRYSMIIDAARYVDAMPRRARHCRCATLFASAMPMMIALRHCCVDMPACFARFRATIFTILSFASGASLLRHCRCRVALMPCLLLRAVDAALVDAAAAMLAAAIRLAALGYY